MSLLFPFAGTVLASLRKERSSEWPVLQVRLKAGKVLNLAPRPPSPVGSRSSPQLLRLELLVVMEDAFSACLEERTFLLLDCF